MYRIKERKLEICDNMYVNMIICVLFFLFAFVVQKKRLLGCVVGEILEGIIPKLSLEGASSINFIL